MDKRSYIQPCLDYIEENLKAEISLNDLADMAGFSVYHFQRLFSATVGMPVGAYTLWRRLSAAIYDTAMGRKISDAAFDYGFDSYSGFFRAFKREFGCSPQTYLNSVTPRKTTGMDLFRKEQLMLSQKKISQVLKSWGLEKENISPVFYESSGFRSDSACYVGEDFVLKYSKNYGKLSLHNAISRELKGLGLASAAAVTNLEGSEIVESEGFFFALTERLKGRQLHAEEFFGSEYPLILGRMLAKLHLCLLRVETEADSNDLPAAIAEALPKVKALMDLPEELLLGLEKEFPALWEELPKQLIHRDPNPANIIRDGDSWGFIDFELSERNARIFDICYAATAILSESFGRHSMEEWTEVLHGIITGYDEVNRLSHCEKSAIPYIILTNQLLSTLWFAEQEQFTELFEVNKKMTEAIVNNFDHLKI